MIWSNIFILAAIPLTITVAAAQSTNVVHSSKTKGQKDGYSKSSAVKNTSSHRRNMVRRLIGRTMSLDNPPGPKHDMIAPPLGHKHDMAASPPKQSKIPEPLHEIEFGREAPACAINPLGPGCVDLMDETGHFAAMFDMSFDMSLSMLMSMSMSMSLPVYEIQDEHDDMDDSDSSMMPTTKSDVQTKNDAPVVTPVKDSAIVVPAPSPVASGSLAQTDADTPSITTSADVVVNDSSIIANAIVCNAGDDVSLAIFTAVHYSYHYKGTSADMFEIKTIAEFVTDSVAGSLCGDRRRSLHIAASRQLYRAVASSTPKVTDSCDGEYCSIVEASIQVVLEDGDDTSTVEASISKALGDYHGAGSIDAVTTSSESGATVQAVTTDGQKESAYPGVYVGYAAAGIVAIAVGSIIYSRRQSNAAGDALSSQNDDLAQKGCDETACTAKTDKSRLALKHEESAMTEIDLDL